MLLPRSFHLPTSIGRTFFPNLPAMPRVPGLEAVCTQATVRNGLFCDSPRAFHHIIAANSASRGGHSSKRLRPFQQNAPVIPARRSDLFSKTLWSFQQNAPAFSAKHLGHFSETPRPFPSRPARQDSRHISKTARFGSLPLCKSRKPIIRYNNIKFARICLWALFLFCPFRLFCGNL